MKELIAIEGRGIYITVIIIYMAVIILIGYLASRRTKTAEDYWVAGRKLGTLVLIGTFGATFISAFTMMGSPSGGYRFGWSFWNLAYGTWIGPLIMILFISYFVRFVGFTIPDIIEARYGPKSRPVAAVVVLFGSFGYAAVQTMAIGTVINAIMGIPFTIALIVGAGIVILYTVLGGMIAVAWTDVLQFIMLVLGMFITAGLALAATGGLSALNSAAMKIDPGYVSPLGPYGSAMVIIGMAVAFALGNPSQPSYLARAFSAKNTGSIRIALGVGTIANVLCIGGGIIIGLSARVLLGGDIARADLIFPLMVIKLMPPVFGGLIIAAIIAAIMSTADSFLLVAGVTIGRDFYQRYINKDASDRQLITISRIVTLIVGVIGLLIAIIYPKSLIFLGAYVFGTVAAGLFVPLYIGMVWKRANSTGGILGIVCGFIGTFVFTMFKVIPLHPIIVGILISTVVFVIATLVTKPEPELSDSFMARIGRK